MANFAKLEIDLRFAIEHKKNVLLVGEKGVGKTQIIKKIFKEFYGDDWRYYSTPTMDPWVDLVGCPKEVKDENGKSYLELIRPKEWTQDRVRGVFLDEANRAQQKIKNALMELLQFKSINGRKFHNLDVIWAAVNPDGGEYQTEELDPAQIDRFSYRIEIPYDLNDEYFADKYGDEVSQAAAEWWRSLDEKKKKLVSPRRLDEALEIIQLGGHIDNVLSHQTNPAKLLKDIKGGSVLNHLLFLIKQGVDANKMTTLLGADNNYFVCKEYIVTKNNSLLEYIPDDRLIENIYNNENVKKYCLENLSIPKYEEAIEEIIKADTNKEMAAQLKNDPNYFTHNMSKTINNKDLKKEEDLIDQLIDTLGLDHVKANIKLDDDPEIFQKNRVHGTSKKSLENEMALVDHIRKNKDKLIASDYAISVLTKGIPDYKTKIKDLDELRDHMITKYFEK